MTDPNDDAVPAEDGTSVGAQDDLESIIGNYELLERIGEGGFGVVYRASQTHPVRREVALKVIKLGMDTKEVIARFAAERQALAMMEHPSISQVFDAGTTRLGRPYFVMELVRGTPITTYCDEQGLDIAGRLDLFLTVCQAVQHAHQKGVIHRDIKPSNVMVTIHDEVAVPKVIDFGIAKATDQRLTEKTLFTEQHQLVGTPEYMAPEQADMTGHDIDTRADVYSLGVLLYELLTGTKPHDLESVRKDGFGAVLEHIREVDPPKPSSRVSTLDGESLEAAAQHRSVAPTVLGKTIGGDLDWIVMKALAKDRARRYESASALAMDVWRYRSDEPVLARPPSRLYRLRKYVRRHRVGVAASCAVGLALVIGGVLALRGYLEAERQLTRAQDAERNAQAEAQDAQLARTEADARAQEASAERDAKADALSQLKTASEKLDIEHAARKEALEKTDRALQRARVMGLVHTSAVAERDDPMRALLLAREAARHSTAAPVVTQLRSALRNSRERALFRGHRQTVHTVALSPDGELVVTASNDFIARLWDVGGGEIDFLSHNGFVYSAVFSPSGERILTAAGGKSREEGEARIWDLEGERLARLQGHTGHVFSATYSPAGDRILTTSWDGTARIWDAAGKQLAVLRVHEVPGMEWSAAFTAAGDQVITVSEIDGGLRVWGLDGKPVHQKKLRDLPVWKPVWIRSHTVLVVTSNGIDVFDHQGKALRTVRGRKNKTLLGAEIAPRQDRVVMLYADGAADVWDLATDEVTTLRGHEAGVVAAAFSPRGRFIATASGDGTARLWDPAGNELAVLRGHEGAVTHVQFLPEGDRVFTIGEDRDVRLWSAEGEEFSTYRGAHGQAPVLRWTDAGGRMLLPQADGSALLLSDVGHELATLRAPKGRVDWSVIAPSGNHVLTGSQGEQGTHLWNARGTRLATVGGRSDSGWIQRLLSPSKIVTVEMRGADLASFSPAGDRFATVTQPGGLRVWDLDGQVVFGVAGNVRDAIFSPSGDRLLVTRAFGGLSLVSATGAHQQDLQPAKLDMSVSVWTEGRAISCFAKSGDRVFGAPEWSVGYVWGPKGGKPAGSFRWRESEFEFATFSPDGDHVFAAMDDKCAYMWDLRNNPPVVFRGHDADITFAVFSPDGKSVLTCSEDKTARLWDLDGNLIFTLGGHERPVRGAMFSEGGDRIFTASEDGTVRVYLARIDDLHLLADRRITRKFTRQERDRYGDLLGPSTK